MEAKYVIKALAALAQPNRLQIFRSLVVKGSDGLTPALIAEELGMPVENMLTPSMLREIAWEPPEEITAETIGQALTAHGARKWQVTATAQRIAQAFVEAPQNQHPVEPEESLTVTTD